MESKKQVFISYGREDWSFAKRLYDDLKHAGISVWIDTENIRPGENMKKAIKKAIKESSYFLALFSSHSVAKAGYVHKELTEALKVLEELPPSEIFIIPVRLDDCKPGDEKLEDLQKVDLFPNYEIGLNQLKRVLPGAPPSKPQPIFNERPIIVLAAHDDGSGAHVTMSYICRAILQTAGQAGCTPFIVYLHQGNYETEWAVELWESTSKNMPWLKYENLEEWPDDEELKDKAGIWLKTENMIQLDVTKDGELDPAKTHERLIKTGSNFDHWRPQIRKIPKHRVVLTIEMGVPQLNKWAESLRHRPPAITVGDQVWSCVLRNTLELAGEYDKETTAAILSLSEYERYATEAWFLPLLAPSDYADMYSIANIPITMLPGFFGQRQAKQGQDIEDVLLKISKNWGDDKVSNALKEKHKKLIVMNVGSRGGWKDINNKVAMSFINGSKDVLLFSQREKELDANLLKLLTGTRNETNKVKLWMVADGKIKEMPQLTSLLPYYALADFGVTRGGIASLEFVNTRTPFLVVQEPNHWLSLKQQAALREAGLAYSCSYLNFQSNAIGLIQKYLGGSYKRQNERIKARMNFMDFEVEDKWVPYILKHHAKIFA